MLSYRCFVAKGQEAIPLLGPVGLASQIGSVEYSRPRRFREKLDEWLDTIRVLWPECPAQVSADGSSSRESGVCRIATAKDVRMKTRAEVHTISPSNRMSVQTKPGMHFPHPPEIYDSIIAVGNVKGGVGKTTLAVNLAICEALSGHDVLLMDGDEQGTARAFTQLRAEQLSAPGSTAVSLQGAEIRT